jgi:hypothetical protein
MITTGRRTESAFGAEDQGNIGAPDPQARGNIRISLEGLRFAMTQVEDNMRSFVDSLESKAHDDHLPRLKETIGKMTVVFPSPPPYSESYTLQWNAFTSGARKNLDLPAVRYLCWKPKIATSDPFLAHLWRAGMRLTSRPLAGLVRSCHAAWKGTQGVYPAAGVIKDFVKQYDGSNQILHKWKSDPNAVFGANGPESLGRAFIDGKKRLAALFDEWYLDPASPFSREVVQKATAACREQFARPSADIMKVLFGELLPWAGWDLSALRREVCGLILKAEGDQARSVLQKFVTIHRGLGDPRLQKNEANWAAMDREARNRLETWLSVRSPAPRDVRPATPVPGTRTPVSAPKSGNGAERVYRPKEGWTTWQPRGPK